MTYPRPALTTSQQRLHLESRGIIIRNAHVADMALTSISLYRFKGYAHYLRDSSTRQYMNTDFDKIIRLINLDTELRTFVFSGLQVIEVGIRTRISEFLTIKYGGDWYSQGAVFPGTATSSSFLTRKLQQEFNSSREDFAVHFRRHHPGSLLPAWVATELYTFAIWSHIFEALGDDDKDAIAIPLGVTRQRLQDALKALTVFRNRVAHHARVWNFRFVPMALPGTGGGVLRRRMLATSMIPVDAEKTVASRLYAMHILLHAFGERRWSRDLRMVNRFHSYGLAHLGFREGWEEQSEWLP